MYFGDRLGRLCEFIKFGEKNKKGEIKAELSHAVVQGVYCLSVPS